MVFKSFQKFIIFILLSLAWLYPFHYYPWLTAENEFFILLIPCLLLFPITQHKKLKINELIFVPTLLILFSLIQYTFIRGFFLENLIITSLYSIFIMLLIFFFYIYNDKKNIIFLLKLIVYTCFFNGFIIIFQVLDYQNIFVLEHHGNKRFYANIG